MEGLLKPPVLSFVIIAWFCASRCEPLRQAKLIMTLRVNANWPLGPVGDRTRPMEKTYWVCGGGV